MKPQRLDFIGDIHGHFQKLKDLLQQLDYVPLRGGYRHPEGRKVVFLGDYVDRGPNVREVLHLVRAMVDAGDAFAIMGNHEWNAICYATPDADGDYLRPHIAKNVKQHDGTLKQFVNHADEWQNWLAWMKRLPLFLDFGQVRAVHACWDCRDLPVLARIDLENPGNVRACATPGTGQFHAIENALKGPEVDLPNGVTFLDKEGTIRRKARIRWWDLAVGLELGGLVMPEPIDLVGKLPDEQLESLPSYADGEPPVFIGHYWMPAHLPKVALAPNIACLDYSGALGNNPLCAYRWEGEQTLEPGKFLVANN